MITMLDKTHVLPYFEILKHHEDNKQSRTRKEGKIRKTEEKIKYTSNKIGAVDKKKPAQKPARH